MTRLAPRPAEASPAEPRRSEQDWLETARRIATELAETVEQRHRERILPTAEVGRLKDSGLTNIFIPAEQGGGGARWRVVPQVVRALAAVDGSVAAIYGYHIIGTTHLRRHPPERRAALEREIARDRLWLAGVANPRSDVIEVRPTPQGYVLNGRKTFCTGAAFADRLTVVGKRSDTGETAIAYLPARRDGIRYAEDWDNLGLDRTESGSFALTDVYAAPEEVQTLEREDASLFPVAIRVPVNQLIFTNLYVGLAVGALESARAYTQTRTQPWQTSGVEKASDDPLVVTQFGELWVAVQSAVALADRAAEKVEALLDAGEDFTPDLRGEAAIAVATAKIQATRVSLDVATRIYDVMGARSTHNRHAFDRFWRDARTHTLHDPLAYKILEVGNFALNGRYPEATGYS